MRFRSFVLFGLALAALTAPAFAGDRCYAPEHVRAERLLRLHSELMVITVACRQGSAGEDLAGAYASFTRKNIGPLHAAEETMTNYYKASYGGKGVDRLDTLRTKLANEYSQQMADVSAPVFCGQKRDKVAAMLGLPALRLNEEVERQYAYDRTYAPRCGEVQQVASAEKASVSSEKKKAKKTKRQAPAKPKKAEKKDGA